MGKVFNIFGAFSKLLFRKITTIAVKWELEDRSVRVMVSSHFN